MSKKIGIAIFGGTGYGAGELLRLLVAHPAAEVVCLTSTSAVGERVDSVHTHVAGCYDLVFEEKLNIERLSSYEHAVVFSSLPHGASAEVLEGLCGELQDKGISLIDLSGDFRLKNMSNHQVAYPKTPEIPELRSQFVYGLPELSREKVKQASFVANPGCFVTACSLAAAPLMKLGLDGHIVFDAKTGTSGAGRSPGDVTHHPIRHASVKAYNMLKHRHEYEIREALASVGGSEPETTFVPHLLPISRGIFVTAHATLQQSLTSDELKKTYQEFYQDEVFVRLVDNSPELCSVVGSNYCDIAVVARGKQVVVMSVIDNLVKGMAGQAIQNMNIMLGLEESAGLLSPGLGPI